MGSRSSCFRSRRKCDDYLTLDVRHLRARGRLTPGPFRWEWLADGEPVGAVRIVADSHGLTLSYRAQERDVDQRVEFTCTPCYFGGRRTWFICPDCRRRCAVVYGVNDFGRFSCRHCMKLAYESEAENVADRLTRKMLKRERMLGEDGEKPKWMRWSTYARICDEIANVEDARIAAFLGTGKAVNP